MLEKLDVYTKPPEEIVEGIPSFVKDDYYFQYFSKPELLHMLSLSGRIGWRNAVVSYPNSLLVRYFTDQRRLMFVPLLSLTPNSKVLDLGAGLGSLSFPIARRNPSIAVYAFDKTSESLFLLRLVKEQEKVSNLHIARVDAGDIPLDNCFFDVILMVGVLEWFGNSTPRLQPLEAQKRALREVYRVLRPRGQLVVGVENRYGYQFLRGEPDHSGLSYTSLMPRYVANLYTKYRLGREYRTFTYSERGYKKLLIETGFENVRFFAALPDYRFPRVVFDVAQAKEVLVNRKASVSARLVLSCMPSRLARFFVPSYFITAVK